MQTGPIKYQFDCCQLTGAGERNLMNGEISCGRRITNNAFRDACGVIRLESTSLVWEGGTRSRMSCGRHPLTMVRQPISLVARIVRSYLGETREQQPREPQST